MGWPTPGDRNGSGGRDGCGGHRHGSGGNRDRFDYAFETESESTVTPPVCAFTKYGVLPHMNIQTSADPPAEGVRRAAINHQLGV